MKLELSRQIFEKSSNIKSHENPSSGCPVVPCERTGMTKLIVAFRNFANAPKMTLLLSNVQFSTSRVQEWYTVLSVSEHDACTRRDSDRDRDHDKRNILHISAS
jgi:hypothetical protein